MDIDKVRLRVEELSQRFDVNPPDVIYGEPPQGADCTLKRRGKNSLIVIGATFDVLPEHMQDADLAWAVAASDRTRLRKEGASTQTAAGIGAAAGTVVAFLFDLPVPVVVAMLALLCVAVVPIIGRQQIYGMDRRVAEVCGEETIHCALKYYQEHPPQMRGLYQLAMKIQPSMVKRAARIG
ncbi:hypothetical protein OHA77_31125 [Streptosporangium sp. NBC_01639]|uniref:hypothetical protein n=1 Tax=Streptosporangium sp. NBC_01639 TaxID=2975948 RepID=UPI003869E4BE|nr:hypothetical protein OHA77_31125 [Streptosporangium sp. NBC_01639]